MYRFMVIAAAIGLALLVFIYSDRLDMEQAVDAPVLTAPDTRVADGRTADHAVLDISVHTVEELQVLFERARVLAEASDQSATDASVVLVLHGPEVDFFSAKNYQQYRDIVDEAARLDALDVIDVRICQSMMAARGITRDEIPSFIEQVPDGQVEIERLVDEGYVYF